MSADGMTWERRTYLADVKCEACDYREGPSRDATKLAKAHAKSNPGHLVFTEQVNQGIYLVPVLEQSEAPA